MTKHLRNMQQQEDGFTLVELLIVVLIIGILAAVAIPVYLGIQAGAHKSAVRSDVNIKVKTIQASLTEGAKVADFLGTTNGTEAGESIQVKASTTTGAAANDFMVLGSESTTGTPKAAIDYTYTYDSVTGNFTDSDTNNVALGGSTPSSSPSPTIAGNYNLTAETSDPTNTMWTFYNNNGSQSAFSSTQNHTAGGSRSIYIPANGYARIYSTTTPLTAGKSYTVTGWVYNTNGQGMGMSPNGVTPANTIGSGTALNTWVQFTTTFTVTNPSTFYINFGSYGGTGSAYIDDITITQN